MISRAAADGVKQHNDELVLLAQLIASLLLKWRHFALSTQEESEHTTCVLDAPLYFRTSLYSQLGRANSRKEEYTKRWNKNVTEHFFPRQTKEEQIDKEHYYLKNTNSSTSKLCEYLPQLEWVTHLTKRSLSLHNTRHEVAHKLFDSEESQSSSTSTSTCECCNTNKDCRHKKCEKNSTLEPSYLSSKTIKQIIADVECVLNGMCVLQDDWETKYTESNKEVHLIQSLLAECERLQNRYKKLQHGMKQMHEEHPFHKQKKSEEINKKCGCTQTNETLPSAQHRNSTLQTNGLVHKADNNGIGVLSSQPLKEVQLHKFDLKNQVEWEHKMREYMEAEINALDNYYKKEQKKREESWECEREQVIEAFTKEYKEVFCALQEQESKWKINEQHALQQDETNERLQIINEFESYLTDMVQCHYTSLRWERRQSVHCTHTSMSPVVSEELRRQQELEKCNQLRKNTAFLFGHKTESSSTVNMQQRHIFHTLPRVPLDNDNLHYTKDEKEKFEELHSLEQEEEKRKSANATIITTAMDSVQTTEHAPNNKDELTKIKPNHVLSNTSASTLTSFATPLLHDVNKNSHALLLSASALPLPLSSPSTALQRQEQQQNQKQEELHINKSDFAPMHFPWQNETSHFTSFKAYCHTRGLPSPSESFTQYLCNKPHNHLHSEQLNKEKQDTKNESKLNDVCNKITLFSTTTNNSNNKSCLRTPHRTSRVVKSLLLSPLDDRFPNVSIDCAITDIVNYKRSSTTDHMSEFGKCNESKDTEESEKEVTLQTLSRQLTASPSISATFAAHLPQRRLMSPSPEHEYEEEEHEEHEAFDNYEHYYQNNCWNDDNTCNRERQETMCPHEEEEEEKDTERQLISVGLVNSYVDSSNVDIVNILEEQTKQGN